MNAVNDGSQMQQLKAGDRLWVWLAEEPSALEIELADALTVFPKLENAEDNNGVFHVRVYSWRGSPDFTQDFLKTHLPNSVELPFERMIKFVKIDKKIEFSIPVAILSFSHSAEAGAVHVSPLKYSFWDQTLMILASRQSDHDRKDSALTGSFDSLGLVSLLSGQILHGGCLLSSYFCITRKKFLSGTLGVVTQSSTDWAPLQFASANQDGLDARDDRTHAALWFAGSAFSSNDNASKIVSYITALEILMGKNLQNYLSPLYRKDKELQKLALEKLTALKSLRGDLVHKGRRVVLSAELERYAQAFILDAIRQNNNVTTEVFAVQNVALAIMTASARAATPQPS
ncbi:hypothetical protein [Bradyrhizobium sp. WSM3983]|uniref:hypothetical protein n=1 Tax=Bradyrhizobium sp. WSM3983 TaxID=1038867 RepID=UPI000485FEED|nr:hypothetical protein [Bradyrhizobium sp. WSM3983]